jgi:hypothetical protein
VSQANFMDIMRDRIAEAGGGARGNAATRRNASPPPAPPATAPVVLEENYTLEEAARRCKVSVKTLRKWKVPRFTEGRIVRVPRASLEKFLAARTALPQDDSQTHADRN